MPIRRPPKKHRTGPLRVVKRVILKTGQLYQQNLVELECKHRVRSNSPVGNRAHCDICQETAGKGVKA
jgi:hypothetical protein